MRINRIALPMTLAAALAAGLAPPPARAQAPGDPPQPQAPQAPAAVAPAAPGGTPAVKADEPATEAEILIDQAIKKVAAVKSVSAELTQDVKMLGEKFRIKGKYLKAPVARVYLRLDVEGLPGSAGTMLQVSDGDVLWDYSKILDGQSYRKLSVKPILERLQAPELDAALKDQILASLGFSGPDALLAGVRKVVKFDQHDEGEYEGKPVLIFRGAWRTREGLVGPDQRPVAPIGRLPAYIPSHATLTVDKENGWPYKLELYGLKGSLVALDTRQVNLDGTKSGSKSSIEKQEPSELTLVYSNVQFDPALSDADFAFQAPPNANVEDNTEAILAGLNRAIEQMALQKRMEAANAGSSSLPATIDVPTPPPAAEIPK
ncbi:MAG: hypothetical protein BGO49_01630 [Planctomycetales bacterium 71-10]|nr:MAG: hypothetical protein BGO49_01630 [Planctomycetales bacterium 71-10]